MMPSVTLMHARSHTGRTCHPPPLAPCQLQAICSSTLRPILPSDTPAMWWLPCRAGCAAAGGPARGRQARAVRALLGGGGRPAAAGAQQGAPVRHDAQREGPPAQPGTCCARAAVPHPAAGKRCTVATKVHQPILLHLLGCCLRFSGQMPSGMDLCALPACMTSVSHVKFHSWEVLDPLSE